MYNVIYIGEAMWRHRTDKREINVKSFKSKEEKQNRRIYIHHLFYKCVVYIVYAFLFVLFPENIFRWKKKKRFESMIYTRKWQITCVCAQRTHLWQWQYNMYNTKRVTHLSFSLFSSFCFTHIPIRLCVWSQHLIWSDSEVWKLAATFDEWLSFWSLELFGGTCLHVQTP